MRPRTTRQSSLNSSTSTPRRSKPSSSNLTPPKRFVLLPVKVYDDVNAGDDDGDDYDDFILEHAKVFAMVMMLKIVARSRFF